MKKIKTIILSLLLLLPFILIQSCTNSHIDRTGFMPPLKIQVPNDVKKDTATMTFIRSSEKVINALSDRMENIAVNGKDLLGKKDKDMSVMDKIKMTKMSVQLLSVGASLTNELVKIQHYIEKKQKEGISETDLKAYDAVEKALEKRIDALNNKYKNLISH